MASAPHKVLSSHLSDGARAYPGFCDMKQTVTVNFPAERKTRVTSGLETGALLWFDLEAGCHD